MPEKFKLPSSYVVQDGCYNCKYVHPDYDWESPTEYFCQRNIKEGNARLAKARYVNACGKCNKWIMEGDE